MHIDATTSPAMATNDPSLAATRLAIRWVFPQELEAPTFVDRQPRIGRGDECDLRLDGSEISREHALVMRDGPLYLLRDLGSSNGTFVDGQRIGDAPLSRGRVVRLGEWVGVVIEVAPREIERMERSGWLVPGLWAGPTLRAAVAPAQKVASSDLPVVIEGETGTGKECVARAIHDWSGRTGPFLAVNCAALPQTLSEAELFGYRKGAFTGADRASPGHFRAAHGGTLLLDEVADLPLELQAKILRVLEQREVQPLGESRPVAIDVRVISAAQEPLSKAVEAKRFRADLYARLDGMMVKLPALRERNDEVPALFTRFLAEAAERAVPVMTARVVEALCIYDWPLNVRELRLIARRTVALHGDEPVLHRSHLPERVYALQPRSEAPADKRAAGQEIGLERLVEALRTHDGVVARAAHALGISRQRAYRLMRANPELDLDGLRKDADEKVDP